MSTLGWIIGAGVLMSSIALVGGFTLLLPPEAFRRTVLPLVALSAGSLLGGALFHMIRDSVGRLGNTLPLYGWIAAGVVSFLVLEQFLDWHHCHRPVNQHRPVGYLILVADALHNYVGGLAVGGAFVLDVRLGIVTWVVAAAHEIPQELGDFGLLIHSGWSPRQALTYNVLSALTFLLGGLTAYAASSRVDVTLLVPFAAGNFIYIATADLIPQFAATCGPARDRWLRSGSFLVGLGALYLVAVATG